MFRLSKLKNPNRKMESVVHRMEPPAQADSHRQKLDRKAQKSPVRKSMEDDLIRLQRKINGQPVVILLDCGSTHDLIFTDFVKRHNLQTIPFDSQLEVDLADGTKTSIPRLTTQPVKVVVNDFNEQQTFTCYPLSNYDAILGKFWLWRNNPAIDFRENRVEQRASTAACSSTPTTGVELMQLHLRSPGSTQTSPGKLWFYCLGHNSRFCQALSNSWKTPRAKH